MSRKKKHHKPSARTKPSPPAEAPAVPKSNQPTEGAASRFPLVWMAWIGLAFAVFAVIIFRDLLLPGQLLLTTDDNIGALAFRKAALPYAMFGGWNDTILLGDTMNLQVTWTYLLLWLMPLKLFSNWAHALDLVAASVFLVLFLRARRLGPLACALGGLTAFWLASNFTLTYAGHINKFGVLVFAGASLWLLEEAAQRRSAAWGILAGAALGTMFLEQADVALFFGIFLFPYGVYAVWRESGKAWATWAAVLLPCAVIAMMVGVRPLWEGYRDNVRGVSVMEDAEAKWNFLTQWSWPPEESVDFVLPGFMGWRSGEPEGPYWGRMGRSAEWGQTQKGFRNFKLENQYLGWLPVMLAVWALALGWARRKEDRTFSREMLFWGVACGLSLWLAFGKYTPLYRLVAMLPMMSSIRNPNKFLQVFQVLLAVLTAYGFDRLLGRSATCPAPRGRKIWLGVLGGVCVVVLMGLFTATLGRQEALAGLQKSGWGGMADRIVALRFSALAWGAVMSGLTLAAFALAFRFHGAGQRRYGTVLAGALVGVVVLDALALSRHYIKTVDDALIRENAVTEVLEKEGAHRLFLPVQQGYFNAWLTYLFPYHNVKTLNFTQMPRMPADYQRLLQEMQKNPWKMWRLCGVDFLLGPAGLWQQIQQTPSIKGDYTLALAYRVQPNGPASVQVVPATPEQPGDQVLVQTTAPAPRAALVAGWEVGDDEAALARMTGPEPAFNRVTVAPETAEGLLPSTGEGGLLAEPEVVASRPGRVLLKTTSSQPALLRLTQRYSPSWKASIDGRPVPVRRCDYIFPGIEVPAGMHTVEFKYAPGFASIWLQVLGAVVTLGALGWIGVKGRR